MNDIESEGRAREFDLASRLAAARPVDTAHRLAASWTDGTVRLRLSGCRGSAGLGAHLRRSFLGALAEGASEEARRNAPCPWDPPCALDVFLREQMRGARGDGLPKPYVIYATPDGDDLLVELRVFGMASFWLDAAAEAMVAGLRAILPWQRVVGHAPPVIAHRKIEQCHGLAVAAVPAGVGLEFLSPVDVSGRRDPPGSSVVARVIRRVAGLSRWQGVIPAPEVTRAASNAIARLEIDESDFVPDSYLSPNRKRQRRTHDTRRGVLWLSGDLTPLWPFLVIGARCHVGRAAVEGLGRYRIVPPG